MKKNKNGSLGEQSATDYLKKNGYEILSNNEHSRYGEIDIIACDKDYIVFVEVKTRFEDSLYLPREAVDFRKQQKLIKTAGVYLSQHDIGKLQPRFDVIEVIVYRQNEYKIKELNHLKNAFTL